VTAAAGAGSTMALGEALAAMNSKTVTIVADGVCTIKGTSALKLQEAEGVKAKKPESSKLPKEETDKANAPLSPIARRGQGSSSADNSAATSSQEQALVESDSIEIEFVDEDGHPVDIAYHLELPDGGALDGQTSEDGVLSTTGFKPGTCKLTLPKTDAARWKLG